MDALITFWSHSLAALVFGALVVWRLGVGTHLPGQRLLLAAFALTCCWAWLTAIGTSDGLVRYAETARNLVWVGLLYSLSARGRERQHGVSLVYGAVAAVLGLQLAVDGLALLSGSGSAEETAVLLRTTAAAGSLVLVHNLYGQAAPASRPSIRFAMLALAMTWIYDLNLYTVHFLDTAAAAKLASWRGVVMALTAPLFALGARNDDGWRIRLSRAATFQTLSLLAICAYFAVMTVLATVLRGAGWDVLRGLVVALLAIMTVGGMVLLPSARARSWAKVKLAKHLFEHRYDYRTEWLRFTATLGSAGPDGAPLGERVVKAFADILDAPGGVLLVEDSAGAIASGAAWNWASRGNPGVEPDATRALWAAIEREGRVLDLDAYRRGAGDARDLALEIPHWIIANDCAWAGVPLIHHERLVGLVLLAAPDYRRALDWEDFDLLRAAGRQAASSLAEAHGQEALSDARRFEEFNRRFAFIMHDIKNLVSQLSLLSRNAERHAENAEFRADMIATLKGSVGKMNDLLARLSPQAVNRARRAEPQPLRPILAAAIAAKRRDHDVRLLGDASPWALVDGASLEQAVGHLLQNAVEASPPDQPVTVRVAAHGDGVTVSIADKGCGMDGEFVRTRLFQPFSSTKPDGFGIGAFEARALVTAMGGRMSVDSAPGAGTTFSIFLPAADADSAREDTRKSA
ncbi:XrtA/PEP-CTERM system histidine kinase PrsK [Sphingomonas sp.]|uniref:XrtA/PEP-CTERM system histidine kinase PrsK n=1 Tax=Sphingomonas sp. TaxID=28214 RepID=UPI00286DE9A0|nr:XrtA/PEP-CTERM system histidine kinase PrsK [Sphingomonas sp.]